MSSTYAQPSLTHVQPSRSTLVRVAVPASALVGGAAVLWAGYLAGGSSWVVGLVVFVATAAAAGIWFTRPRLGGILLSTIGTVVLVASGAGLLIGGSVPWLLVAFWGGTATLLAAIMDLVAAPEPRRDARAAVAAVGFLLVLSAVGLAVYVQQTWHAEDRAMLQSLPIVPTSPVVHVRVEPAANGSWYEGWALQTSDPAAELKRATAALAKDGWKIRTITPVHAVAAKNDYLLDVVEQMRPAAAGLYTGEMSIRMSDVHRPTGVQ